MTMHNIDSNIHIYSLLLIFSLKLLLCFTLRFSSSFSYCTYFNCVFNYHQDYFYLFSVIFFWSNQIAVVILWNLRIRKTIYYLFDSNKKQQSQPNHFNLGCYAQRFGARGYGHIGMSSLGLMSDIRDKEWQRYLLLRLCLFHVLVFHLRFLFIVINTHNRHCRQIIQKTNHKLSCWADWINFIPFSNFIHVPF